MIPNHMIEGLQRFFEGEERGPIAIVAVLNTQGNPDLGVAVANERGYHPLTGWARFETFDAAEAEADRINAQLHQHKDTAFRIVCSTMGGMHYGAA